MRRMSTALLFLPWTGIISVTMEMKSTGYQVKASQILVGKLLQLQKLEKLVANVAKLDANDVYKSSRVTRCGAKLKSCCTEWT